MLVCCWRCDRFVGPWMSVWDEFAGPFCSRLCMLTTQGERDG